jgi:hypothetical protein
MSTQCEVTGRRAAAAPMSTFERYPTVWVHRHGVRLVEVPVMLLVVRVVNSTRAWYGRRVA